MVIFLSDAFRTMDRHATRPRFCNVTEIREVIQTSKNYAAHDGTPPTMAGALLIYQTQRQQTWVVATRKRLYFILDDLSYAEPKVQWSGRIERFTGGDGRILPDMKTWQVDAQTGSVQIAEDTGEWLYSSKLFTLDPVGEQIRRLISKQLPAAA